MDFYFRSLCSGSDGNSYLFITPQGSFLIDAGGSYRKQKSFLHATGVTPSSLSAILVTHDHYDHSRNLARYQADALKAGKSLPIYITKQSLQGVIHNPGIKKKPSISSIVLIEKEIPINLCGCTITPFHVPHDSHDNVGYLIEYEDTSLCLVTDVGLPTPTISQYISRTANLIIEANYDDLMLEQGPYPLPLKRRIRSNGGHLANHETAQILFDHSSHLRKVWLCHLSENNNTPEAALNEIRNKFLQQDVELKLQLNILSHRTPSEMFSIE